MKPYRITTYLMATLMSSCDVITSNQGLVIEKARSIRNYPVSRTNFVRALDLSKVDSNRTDIGLRAGWLSYIETWDHPNGLKVYAYDQEYFGTRPLEGLANKDFTLQTAGVTVEGIPSRPPKPHARQSFQQVIITTKSGRELFRSETNRKQNVEQAASSNH